MLQLKWNGYGESMSKSLVLLVTCNIRRLLHKTFTVFKFVGLKERMCELFT